MVDIIKENFQKHLKLIAWISIAIILSIFCLYSYYINGDINKYLIIAIILGFYLAMAMWSNDVANNMWPAVWSKALTITGAIIIAAIFEAAWAIIAWWDVAKTIKWWIIDPSNIKNYMDFVYIMISTLFWAALWVNIATISRLPVSATHSVIWWLIWAWIMSHWLWIVNWSKILEIAASWIISPLMGWWLAALFSFLIWKSIFKKEDRIYAAKKYLPIYISLAVWIFSIYLIIKWLKNIIHIEKYIAFIIGIIIWLISFLILKYFFNKKYIESDSKKQINKLFNFPLIFAVSLLSFAHWSNDVANAIWPVAAIYDTFEKVNQWIIISKATIPTWILILWWLWLSFWLAIWWKKIIQTVGWEITKLNQSRAFSIALATAITVLIASNLWLPISTTHVAIWWVFWVWFLRMWQKRNKKKNKKYIDLSLVKNIILAWIVTLPASAIISAILFFVLKL